MPTPPPSPASAVVGNDNAGTNADDNNEHGELAKDTGIGTNLFPPLLVSKSALSKFPLLFPPPLLPPPSPFPSSPLYPMFPSSSFSPSLLLPPPPPQDMPLCSPCSLLWRDLNPYPDLDLDLNISVNDPGAELPLDLSLPLLQGVLFLDPDLVLT